MIKETTNIKEQNAKESQMGFNKNNNQLQNCTITNQFDKINNENINKTKVTFFKLEYALADKKDIMLISFACIGSLITGAAMPLISLILGKVINQFNGSIENKEVPTLVSGLIFNFLLAGVAIFIGSFMMIFFWTVAGSRLINKINSDYFRVIMQQEQGWFDQSNMFEFATKVQGQIKVIENGVNYLIIKYLDRQKFRTGYYGFISICCFIFSRIYYFLEIVISYYIYASSSRNRRLVYGKRYGAGIVKYENL
jgi:ABC-type multidrug transport system fused ATPase/permease subunit